MNDVSIAFLLTGGSMDGGGGGGAKHINGKWPPRSLERLTTKTKRSEKLYFLDTFTNQCNFEDKCLISKRLVAHKKKRSSEVFYDLTTGWDPSCSAQRAVLDPQV